MIYTILGTNKIKTREKAMELVNRLLSKKPDALFFKIDFENFSEDKIMELSSSRDLFEQKYIVLVDNLLSDKKTRDILGKGIKKLSESENVIIILDSKLNKKEFELVKKFSTKILEFNEDKITKQKAHHLSPNEFSIFSIADAFGKRDKKTTWVLYQKAILSGVPPEEILHILSWQIKNILLVSNSKKTGLKSFVEGKAKSFSRNFQKEELKKMSSQLVSIYHNSRRGIIDTSVALEKFLLNGK